MKYLNTLQDWEIDSSLPKDTGLRGKFVPLEVSLDDELDAKAGDAMTSLREKQSSLLKSLGDEYSSILSILSIIYMSTCVTCLVARYSIKGTDEDWERELKGPKGKKLVPKVSIPRNAPATKAGGGVIAGSTIPNDGVFTRKTGTDKRGKKRKSISRG